MKLTVYGGSRPGSDPAFADAAQNLGAWMASRHIALVYGGGGIGMMGSVADAVLDGGGEVTGVIPQFLADREQAYKRVADMRIVSDMDERKALLRELGDAMIALPGGPGTLEEITESISLRLLDRHEKPCLIYNVNGCWDALITQYENMARNGFLSGEALFHIHVVRSLRDVERVLTEEGLCGKSSQQRKRLAHPAAAGTG